MPEVDKLLAHIRETWPDPKDLLGESDDPYRSLPLCVIDAVYSIGVKYESTLRTVDDFCKWAGWNYSDEYSVQEFLDLTRGYAGNWQALAANVFRNRQRTSTKSGILKAEAVYRFAQELQKCSIDRFEDLPKIGTALFSGIAAIPGQGSGISLKYFLMLAGYNGIVKPDRMVARFVAEALGRESIPADRAETLVLSAYEVLRDETPQLTATMLDYRIWTRQRAARQTSRQTERRCA